MRCLLYALLVNWTPYNDAAQYFETNDRKISRVHNE